MNRAAELAGRSMLSGAVRALLLAAAAGLPLGAKEPAVEALEVFPGAIQLGGPRSLQRLVVAGRLADGSRVDVSGKARIAPADPDVAAIEALPGEGRPAVRPRGDGETRLRVEWCGAAIEVAVTVRGHGSERPPRFADEVIGELTRAGCNSGTCHGAQHGKGGFKLSLLGYEPEEDLIAITRETGGRRAALFDPAESLILKKPLAAMEHGGGKRFEPGSPAHVSLDRWLEAGAPGPAAGEPTVESIEVLPAGWRLSTGEAAHFVVQAKLSDGSVEDVTGRALLSSLNDGVAAVEPIDDPRVTNPPTNPELLDALADELIRTGFDQKAFLRTILRSRALQLSSAATPENRAGDAFFSHYRVERLPAEVLFDALVAATGVPERTTQLTCPARVGEL